MFKWFMLAMIGFGTYSLLWFLGLRGVAFGIAGFGISWRSFLAVLVVMFAASKVRK